MVDDGETGKKTKGGVSAVAVMITVEDGSDVTVVVIIIVLFNVIVLTFFEG